jgi:uncharacterized membrane protein
MADLLLSAPVSVQIHVASALVALSLTPVQFWRRVGDRPHRAIGYLWVLAMAATSLSSFWIHDLRLLGPFSPIHGLSAYVLLTLLMAIRAVRRGDIVAHRRMLRDCAFWGLGVAGLFTLLPGRLMGQTLFPDLAWAGFGLAVCLFLGATLAMRLRRSKVLR